MNVRNCCLVELMGLLWSGGTITGAANTNLTDADVLTVVIGRIGKTIAQAVGN